MHTKRVNETICELVYFLVQCFLSVIKSIPYVISPCLSFFISLCIIYFPILTRFGDLDSLSLVHFLY
jgi:hypothetical protein